MLQEAVLQAKGRHDPCVVPRALPIVEAMAALVLAEYVPAITNITHVLDSAVTCPLLHTLQHGDGTARAAGEHSADRGAPLHGIGQQCRRE